MLQIEKFKAYDWEYTEKGWLIWEKALSQNEEMDMHSFFRILPLEEKCREFGNKYIRPVSYFCNNLFLVNWDVDSMDKIEFNDLYDFLYEMKFGRNLDEEKIQAGIEKGEFESVIQTFFDISQEELESFARYNSQQGIYPWEPIGAWNRVQQFQPFPEVVKCTENQDGTWTLYVEAIFVEKGSDCYFKHTVTMKEEDGRWIYTGNRIEEGAERLPGYKPRREFVGSQGTGFRYVVAFFINIFRLCTFRAIADNTKRLKLFSIRFYNITFIDEDYWFGWDELFHGAEIRSSCRCRSSRREVV